MSHYTEIKVDMKVKFEKQLIAALKEMLGDDGVEVFPDGTKLGGGYDKKGTKLNAHIVIRKETLRKKLGVYGYNDVGFERMSAGEFKMHVDALDFPSTQRGLLLQKYSTGVLIRTAKESGQSWEKKVLSDGRVQITIDTAV